MGKFFRHIAILLCLLFAFPIAYQSWHLVHNHHSRTHISSLSTNEYKKEQSKEIIYRADHHCHVCEYHFPICELPQLADLNFTLPEYNDFMFPFNSGTDILFPVAQNQPRAPPALL